MSRLPRSRRWSSSRFESISSCRPPIDDRSLIDTHVARVEVQAKQLIIQLTREQKSDRRRADHNRVLRVPWQKTPSTRRREILLACLCPAATRSPNSLRDPSDLGRLNCPRPPLARRTDRRPDGDRGKHRTTRGLQRAAGEHDDISRIPCTRPCQGRDRRSPATRHRRHAIARCAGRVVTPICDAGAGSTSVRAFAKAAGSCRQERVLGPQRQRARNGSLAPTALSQRRLPSTEIAPIARNFTFLQERSKGAGLWT